MTLIGRSDETVTTGITTAVVMVVAALSPHNAWRQPVLRMLYTAVGVGVGVASARLSLSATHRYHRAAPEPPNTL
jgi:predicted anti-sigma-YlaC factor YlaD